MDIDELVSGVCPPLDDQLFRTLLDEYLSQERWYALGEWEPGELDGGQFAEVASRIVYHQDSGTLNQRKAVDKCLRYVENDANPHQFPEPQSARHLARAIRLIYKFRSSRGVAHISPTYNANQLDGRLVMDCCRWVLSEVLRIFWTGDAEEVARVIREIVRYEVPAIGEFEDRWLVQRTDVTTEEEILLLLRRAGEEGLLQARLVQFTGRARGTVSSALKNLSHQKRRQITRLSNRQYVLTALGCKTVLEELVDKRFPG